MSTLYAKITNENGKTAGKGGNEYLDIDIQVGNQRLARLTIREIHDVYSPPTDKRAVWAILNEDDEVLIRSSIEALGKTQKDIEMVTCSKGHTYHKTDGIDPCDIPF